MCHQLGHDNPKCTQQKSWTCRKANNVNEDQHQELIMEVTPVKESSPTEQNQVENRPVEMAIGQNHAKPPDQLEKVVTSPTIDDVAP
jgi:hypothetical protein